MKNEMLQMIRETKSDQELDKLISNKIGYENYFNTKGETLGIDTDLNPKRSIYDGSDDDLYDDSILEWDGYIPFGTKIVYNTWYYNQENLSFNGGGYYYLDDESYIKEFIYFIKDKDIPDIESLIGYVYTYLRNKLEKVMGKKDRMDIHRPIYKDEDNFFEPINQHSIKDFYNNGSALCSEYGVMGQNILSFLDMKPKIIITGSHAFQLIKIDEDYYALDFSKVVAVLDSNLNLIDKIPYFNKIGPLSEEWFDRFFNGEEEIKLKEYYIQILGNSYFKMQTNMDRIYKLDVDIMKEDLDNVGVARTFK